MLISLLGHSQYNSSAPWIENKETSKQGNLTIDELKNSFNNYWKTHDKDIKGSGYKPFMRWEYHWNNKVNEQGKLISPEEMWNGFYQKKAASANRNSSATLVSNWQPIGPFTHTNTGSWSSGQGRVNIVHVDPSNTNTVYIGTPCWRNLEIY